MCGDSRGYALMLSLTIISAWFLADVITGLVHWFEDHYLDGDSRFKVLNDISKDNDLHHEDPTAFVNFTHWENISTSLPPAWGLAGLLYLSGAPLVLVLAFVFAAFANIIHRWGHLPERKLNPVVLFLQKTGIFITGRHHREHHYYEDGGLIDKEDTTVKWCAMTNYMNPILDGIRFYKVLEYGLSVIGIRRSGK